MPIIPVKPATQILPFAELTSRRSSRIFSTGISYRFAVLSRVLDMIDMINKIRIRPRIFVLVQREMETSIGGLGSFGCRSCLVVLGFSA